MSARLLVYRVALVLLILPIPALAAQPDRIPQRANNPVPIHGGPADATAKVSRDTFLIMGPTGSGAPYIGDFESPAKALDPGDPATHGWTSLDITQVAESNWHVSEYFAVNGVYSAYCGDETIPSCDGVLDPDGGYGPGWNDLLEFRGTVTDNSVSTTLAITASANIYSEPGYDGTTLQAEKFDVGFVDIAYWEGISNALPIDETVTYQPDEYLGPGADEIVLVWRFTSDGGWDDADCSFPSSGGIQLDDVTITSDNGVSSGGIIDFEDGTLGPFEIRLPQGVGDFAWLWSNLHDVDDCRANFSRQVAFIDNGIVVPGTGGSPCQDWCYGPGGFIVTTTGGLAGPTSHIHNPVESPVMEWPDPDHRGALFTFTVYRHEDLSADAPGSFYTWGVRSTNTGDPADIVNSGWQDRSFVQYGGPDYLRSRQVVSDLMYPNPTHVQVQLAVYEVGWVWGWTGNDGYPAPYFDNIRWETFPMIGPGLATREIDLAQDNFPASGTIDMSDPASLSVRFDGTQDISPASHNHPATADSFCFDAVVTRRDAVLVGPPQLHYKVKRNPVFDPYRTSALPAEGQVDCQQVFNAGGLPVPDRYFGELDDEGFLFPGDILHYFVTASDRDTFDNSIETSIMPADTTGFSDFQDFLNYHSSFRVVCLPTINDLSGTQPPVIFWNDFANRGGQQEWYGALRNLGLRRGVDFDEYYTNGPSSGVGNGLGGRATPLQLAGYGLMLYTAGDLSVNTISNGDLNSDSGPDAELVMAWLDSGDKNLFATGDDLASDLDSAGLVTHQLVTDYFNVVVNSRRIRDLIGGQVAPRILPVPGNLVFNTVSSWVAYGGCGGINSFDAVTPGAGAVRIASFADVSGADGGYPYSAGTVASGVGTAGTSEVVSLPYDFMFIYTDPDEGGKAPATLAGRARVLQDILARFGVAGDPASVSGADLPQGDSFGARHHPNPFNPLVNISLTITRPGRLTVKVYDVRGRLVRSLFDERVSGEAGLVWDGRDEHGADAASGVYFYEARMHNETRVGKLTLVR